MKPDCMFWDRLFRAVERGDIISVKQLVTDSGDGIDYTHALELAAIMAQEGIVDYFESLGYVMSEDLAKYYATRNSANKKEE
jgi:hypothetical protein